MPIYCTSFLAVEEDKQQKIARVRVGPAARRWVWLRVRGSVVL